MIAFLTISANQSSAQDGPAVELGVGFGQDFGGFGAQLDVLPIKYLSVFGGAGLLPGNRLGYNAGVQVIPIPAWKDALFICAMFGYHTGLSDHENRFPDVVYQLTGVKSDKGFDPVLLNGVSVGLGTRISTGDGSNKWKLAILMPLRSGEARDLARDLDLMPITLSVGYHFALDR